MFTLSMSRRTFPFIVGVCAIVSMCASFVMGGRYVYVQKVSPASAPAPAPAPAPIPEPDMTPP